MYRVLLPLICLTGLVVACETPTDEDLRCIFSYEVVASPPRNLNAITLGDSVALRARRHADCPGTGVLTWTVDPDSVATLRVTSDSSVMVRTRRRGVATVNVRTNSGETGFTTISVVP